MCFTGTAHNSTMPVCTADGANKQPDQPKIIRGGGKKNNREPKRRDLHHVVYVHGIYTTSSLRVLELEVEVLVLLVVPPPAHQRHRIAENPDHRFSVAPVGVALPKRLPIPAVHQPDTPRKQGREASVSRLLTLLRVILYQVVKRSIRGVKSIAHAGSDHPIPHFNHIRTSFKADVWLVSLYDLRRPHCWRV